MFFYLSAIMKQAILLMYIMLKFIPDALMH